MKNFELAQFLKDKPYIAEGIVFRKIPTGNVRCVNKNTGIFFEFHNEFVPFIESCNGKNSVRSILKKTSRTIGEYKIIQFYRACLQHSILVSKS